MASWGIKPVSSHELTRVKEVVYAGRFSDIKGTDLLHRVTQEVLSQVQDARFLLAGGVPYAPRAEKKWLESISADLDEQCKDRLEIAGWLPVQDLCRRLNSTWVMLTPSRFETFGMSVLQAMAHSVPVVAAKSPGTESLLSHGKNGYLTSHDDLEAMAENLVKILRSPELRDRLGENARREVTREWLWNHRIPEWLQIYDELQ